MSLSKERLDIVIFGASGFTGKYTVEELHRISKYYEKNLTWGIAGRSEEKLKDVLNQLIIKTGDALQDVRVIIADIDDEASLRRMASQAKVVINCCGPYRFFGPAVVKACVEEGTHHVDVSGEPAYMENMQLKYHEAAKRAGVYVVSACGFDSIPADLGVVFLQQNFKGTVNSCEAYLRTLLPPEGKGKGKGSNTVFNYATWESLINGVKELSELKAIRKELNPKRQTPLKPLLNQKGIIHKNPVDNFWYVPFPGADRPVVNRTQRFLNETYKTRPAQFHAYFGFPYMKNALSTLLVGSVISFLTKFSTGQKLLLNHPKFFTLGVVSREGPSEENMKNTSFMVAISGEGWNEDEKDVEGKAPTKTMRVEVTGVNPGYGATCTCVIYSAITLLREYHKIPGTGGVLTPGAAFSNTSLIENLQKHNVNFRVVSVNKLKAKL